MGQDGHSRFNHWCRGGCRILRRRGRQSQGGAPTYKFARFSQKLHEIKKILVRGGGGGVRAGGTPLDPPLWWYLNLYVIICKYFVTNRGKWLKLTYSCKICHKKDVPLHVPNLSTIFYI